MRGAGSAEMAQPDDCENYNPKAKQDAMSVLFCMGPGPKPIKLTTSFRLLP